MRLQKIAAIAASAVALLALSTTAQALSITPSTPGVSMYLFPPSNCAPGCVYNAFGLPNDGSLQLLYKADSAREGGTPSNEEGLFASSYSTVFSNSLQNSTITFGSGSSINCGVCYLVVKDGNHAPNYYFFDLNQLGWNGTDALELTGFWPGPGSISHVDIWGVSERSVPEPGTLGLLGLGLAGMAAGMRRRRKQH